MSRRALLGLGADAADGAAAGAASECALPRTVIQWESATLDAAVFEAIRAAERAGDRTRARAYASAMEGAYVAAGSLARRLHADGVNAEFAAQLHLSRVIVEALALWPRVARAASQVFVERAATTQDEQADLRDVGSGRALHLLVRPERFADPPEHLARWLAHELAHVDDLVDPAFGATTGFAWPGRTPGEQHRQRDRYRALWCLSIDARLAGRGLARRDPRERRVVLDETFPGVPASLLDGVVAVLAGRAPAHAELLAACVDPRTLAVIAGVALDAAEARALETAARPATCPLCAFPTAVWSRPDDWTAAMVSTVRRRRPQWSPADGACEMCRECIESRAGSAVPTSNPGGA